MSITVYIASFFSKFMSFPFVKPLKMKFVTTTIFFSCDMGNVAVYHPQWSSPCKDCWTDVGLISVPLALRQAHVSPTVTAFPGFLPSDTFPLNPCHATAMATVHSKNYAHSLCLLWLTHWGWVTHIFVCILTIIGSDNGLLPGQRQVIIWTNAGILLIALQGTNFSEILIKIQIFSFKKMHLMMSSAKWRPFCFGLTFTSLTLGQACDYLDACEATLKNMVDITWIRKTEVITQTKQKKIATNLYAYFMGCTLRGLVVTVMFCDVVIAWLSWGMLPLSGATISLAHQRHTSVYTADSRFAPIRWETALLCNDFSHWLGASLESAWV